MRVSAARGAFRFAATEALKHPAQAGHLTPAYFLTLWS
ncbi:hypothetical protein SAMN05444165_6227 [Paraburkholderia phenazinium]|uniref:Uncharacterized protein n=1 Tax=Paraburkholderia phenazinium TaxID=60549 RepID=A0A1N6L6F0_9BURK|nr:hypothetical protein SAMN05444165_6227 [Paraburkholderia phenazinium]